MMRGIDRKLKVLAAVAVAVAACMAFGVSSALAAGSPRWRIVAGSEPSAAVPASEVANEVQDATIGGTEGSWYLYKVASNEGWFPGTTEGEHHSRSFIGPMAYDATAAEVQAKIESSLGAGNVVVTGGEPEGKPYRIEFTGELAASEVKVEKIFALKKATGSIEEVSKGHGLTRLTATAINVGAAPTSGTASVSMPLPAGFVARKVASGEETLQRAGIQAGKPHPEPVPATCEVSGGTATCSVSDALIPGDGVRMVVAGYTEAGDEHLRNEPTVTGGGAGEAKAQTSVPVGGTVPFGIEPGSLMFATSATAAGGHPNVTTGFTIDQRRIGLPAAYTRTINLRLPRGLIGDPRVTRTCTMAEVNGETCPAEDAVGVATARIGTGEGGNTAAITALVYNVAPNGGEPAAFAFNATFPVRLDTRVGPEGDYHVEIHVHEVTEAESLLSSYVTLWGAPGEYTGTRSEEVEGHPVEGPLMDGAKQGFGIARAGSVHSAFLDYPGQCAEALTGTIGLVSWPGYDEAGVLSALTAVPQALDLPSATECEGEPFAPSMQVQSSNATAGRPAGYTVKLGVPQSDSASEPSTAEVRNVEVAMPPGTVISPSAANGLTSCSEAQFEKGSDGEGHCPSNSNVGKVEIVTPLLTAPLKGNVYVGEPQCGGACSPQQAAEGRMVRLLLEAYGSGVRLKLAGSTKIDQADGRLTTVFADNPQLPFSELSLSLKNGEDAPLVNPNGCGNVVATANITPWSSTRPVALRSPAIGIGGCSAAGFAPTLNAGMTATRRGGAFSPFVMTLTRPEGQQTLSTLGMHMPPGMEAILAGVPRCSEAQANSATCPADTQIGTTTAVVGPGSEPYAIEGGKVFLTEKYDGAPFGLAIVTPAKAGPFTLAGNAGNGNEVVRASINVNPTTAAITIDAALPTALDGIPLSIDKVIVDVNRANFMFNPTDCNAMSITATVDSRSGTAANVATPFQADNCAALPFHPTLTAETHAHHTRRKGSFLKVSIAAKAGEADLAKVKVTLPQKLPAQLSTLKQACLQAQFKANPAACPAAATVGRVVVHTPVLASPLEGPAIFVSHGGAKFPDLAFVLQGEGVTIIQEGTTNIHKDFTTSSFNAIPDVPVSSIEVILPEGPKAALGGNTGKLCYHRVTRRKRVVVRRHGHLVRRHGHLVHRTVKVRHRKRLALIMPTTITGQNGAIIHQRTKLAVRGCGKAHSAKHHGHHKHHHKRKKK